MRLSEDTAKLGEQREITVIDLCSPHKSKHEFENFSSGIRSHAINEKGFRDLHMYCVRHMRLRLKQQVQPLRGRIPALVPLQPTIGTGEFHFCARYGSSSMRNCSLADRHKKRSPSTASASTTIFVVNKHVKTKPCHHTRPTSGPRPSDTQSEVRFFNGIQCYLHIYKSDCLQLHTTRKLYTR